MRTHRADCSAVTRSPLDLVDITADVQNVLEDSGIVEGRVTVMCTEPSCRLILQEWESGFKQDLRDTLERMMGEGVEARGVAAGSASIVLPASSGRLRLGTWQRLQLVELEDGRNRKVAVQIVGE